MTTSDPTAPTRADPHAEHDAAIRQQEATVLGELAAARSALSRALRSTKDLTGPLYAVEWAEGYGMAVAGHIRTALGAVDDAKMHAERTQRAGMTVADQVRELAHGLRAYGDRYAGSRHQLDGIADTLEVLQRRHPDDDPPTPADPAA